MQNDTGDTAAPERAKFTYVPGQLELTLGRALDDAGHYCGQNATTGEMTPTPPELVGYCGPDCSHCAPHPFYAVEDGVWVCAADSSYLDA